VILLLPSWGAAGQLDLFERQRLAEIEKGCPQVQFTLRFKDGKTQFHPGETIHVELLFSCQLTNAYALDAATYDRSGRLPSEHWHLDPEYLAIDPLSDYFAECAGMMGGLRSEPMLTEKPYSIVLDLNEWFRFDHPGKYRLYDTSDRAIDQQDPCGSHQERSVTSNVIEFEILPSDERWSTHTLQDAVAALDEPARREDQRDAARTLRFLDTPASARELVKRLGETGDDNQFEYHLGIFSSPQRDLLMNLMDRALLAPDYAVSDTFLFDFARLKYLSTQPGSPPPYPSDPSQIPEWREAMQTRRNEQDLWHTAAWQRLVSAIPRKRGTALAASLATALEFGATCSPRQRPDDWQERCQQLRTELAANFELLSVKVQANLLNYRWSFIKTPELLPALRHLVALPPQAPYPERTLHGVAMRRLLQLSPQEGRTLILQEIQNLQQGCDVTVLCSLPERTLPELDEALIEQLECDDGFDQLTACCHLIDRYASPAITERVKEFVGDPSKGWACDVQAPLLKYLLRVDPDYGAKMVEKALAVQSTGCRHFLLTAVATPESADRLQAIAIQNLDNPDPAVAADAAKMLGAYGSPEVEWVLQQRLQQFYSEWKDHADDLCYRPGAANTNIAQGQFESALVDSLVHGISWLPNKSQLQEIESHCLTPNSLNVVAASRMRWGEDAAVFVSLADEHPPMWRIGDFNVKSLDQLERKMSQFPLGTRFLWQTTAAEDPDYERQYESIFTELQQFASGKGMRLERLEPQD
jgi:hypothetical protein